MTMIVLSLVPPLWNRTVNPLLAEWDRNSATEAERRLLLDGAMSLKSALPAE
jgi:hypothetical protein